MIKNYIGSMKKMEPKKKSMPKKELVGKQNKLDMNKNGKIDAEDFKMLKK